MQACPVAEPRCRLYAQRSSLFTVCFCNGGSGLIGNSGRKTANVCDKHTKETIRNIAAHFIVPAFNILLRESQSKVPRDDSNRPVNPELPGRISAFVG